MNQPRVPKIYSSFWVSVVAGLDTLDWTTGLDLLDS